MLTRFLPFLLFSSKKPTPGFIRYLGKVLPGAIFSMLVVYCLRGFDIGLSSRGIPETICSLLVVGLYVWKRNVLLPIAAGTVLYMFLVQQVL